MNRGDAEKHPCSSDAVASSIVRPCIFVYTFTYKRLEQKLVAIAQYSRLRGARIGGLIQVADLFTLNADEITGRVLAISVGAQVWLPGGGSTRWRPRQKCRLRSRGRYKSIQTQPGFLAIIEAGVLRTALDMTQFVERHAGALQLVFVIGVVGLALLLSISLRPDSAGRTSAAPVDELVVSVVTPVATPYEPVVQLNGVVQARTLTRIIPQVSGRVIKVSSSFRPGGSVAKGDLLFAIDPADYTLAVERTLAEIAAARSELTRLEAEAAAEREIWQAQFPDRKIPDLIARVPQIAAAQARIDSGKAARQAAELALDRTTLRAPFDARILETELDIGQVVGTSAAVGSMFSIDSLEIVVPVSAEDQRLIGPLNGQQVSIMPSASAAGPIAGELVRASASLDERTRQGTLYVAMENQALLTLGEFVTVEISGKDAPDAFRLPVAALTSRDRLWVVENGRLSPRTVEVLGRDADLVVVSVFDDADGVVAIPPSNAREDMPVVTRNTGQFATVENSASDKQ